MPGAKTTDLQNATYWRVIPTYIYARCPICGTICEDPANTYRLDGWHSGYISGGALQDIAGRRCLHFCGVHTFVNLHGQPLPVGETFSNGSGEIPYLTPWLILDDIPSYVVLHALPICRTEGNQFVPRYTVFVLTYFNADPQLVWRRHIAQAREQHWPTAFNRPTKQFEGTPNAHHLYDPAMYDLALWAERGRLGWIDYTQDNHPLCIGQGAQLPQIYRRIVGRYEAYDILRKSLPR